MKIGPSFTTIQGQQYEVWSDFIKRGTLAMNTTTGETKQISYSGYVHKDLTVRKYIASAFRLDSFRATPQNGVR